MNQVALPDVTSMNIASLYVGDLRPEVTEQALWNAFSPYGQVLSVKICRNSQNQVSLGYGYVNYRTQAEAEKALKAVNFTTIEGRQCRVMWSMRDNSKRKGGLGNLFIKNIDPVLDTKSLYEAFSAFGPVMSCKIAVDEYGLSKGYGFIQFFSERDAEEARKKSDGVPFMKKKIVVTKFIPKASRLDAKPVNPTDFTNVFVKNFGTELTTEQLRALFTKFGEITSCVIQADEKTKLSLGYGFVNFATPASASEAVKEMDGHELPNSQTLSVCRAMKKNERTAYLKRQYEEKKKDFIKKHINMNLYVKNFEESVDDDELRKMFSPYGEITSAHVMLDENSKSRGFGFVCYSTVEEAKHAIDEMNGKVIETKPLYVAYAQTKEERRRIMEQRNYDNNFRNQMFAQAAVPVVYPQPAPLPYPPPPYPRYQNPGRQQPRPMQAVNPNMQMQPYQQPGVRPAYGYHPGVPQGHYRGGRGGMSGHSQGGNRGSGGYNQRVHAAQQQPVQVSINQVVTEPAQPKQSKEATVRPQKPPIQDSRTAQKDRIYQITQRIFTERSFDMSIMKHMAGVVIDYFSNSAEKVEDCEIEEAILNAYESTRDPDSKSQK